MKGEEIPVRLRPSAAVRVALGGALAGVLGGSASAASSQTYDINTLAGKVASLYGTAGLQIRFSAFIEEEAEAEVAATPGAPPITPAFVPSSPLDGNNVLPPNVTANQDTAGAPQ